MADTGHSCGSLIEEIGSAAMLAGASDAASMHELEGMLEELLVALAPEDASNRADVRACLDLLHGLAEGRSEDHQAVVSEVARAMSALQVRRFARAAARPECLPVNDATSRSVVPEQTVAMDDLDKDVPKAEPTARPSASDAVVERDAETVAMLGEFLSESEELLSQADRTLMDIDAGDVELEKVNSLFRNIHSIKGSAGFLSLQQIGSLAHQTETLLGRARDPSVGLHGAVVDVIFDSTTMLREMLGSVRRAVETGSDIVAVDGLPSLLARLDAATHGGPLPAEPLPPVQSGTPLGQILVQTKSVSPRAVEKALETQRLTGRRLGEELIAVGAAQPKQIAQALRAQASAGPDAPLQLQETIKVDVTRVDGLVEMIGELVIVESMVVHAPEIAGLGSPKVRNYLSQLTKIARDLQDVGMRMRMVPVRGVFQKMARMVRDLSRKNHKEIVLVQSGEATEMDRSMVEQLGDPLVHMIRNAVDHGIETVEERKRAGKPAVGTVRLSARHEGGAIVIELADDGRGLDKAAILKKARAQNLVKADQKLSDSEIYQLIFSPGFSTAREVTEISGRGVGMDVVRRNIEAVRGRVILATEPGRGTTVKLVLPLTLAIIDGMLVDCGCERYIIPTLSIVESIQPSAAMVRAFSGRAEVINIRGVVLPLLRLARLLRIEGAKQDAATGLVVVLETAGRKMGLLVDEVVTPQQVVIKSLGSGLHGVRYLSGAAIMPDGRVGLILNVDEIASLARDAAVSAPERAMHPAA